MNVMVFSRNLKTMFSHEKSRVLHKSFYCTYFDYNFAPFGLSLLESLSKYDSTSFVYVLCLDDNTFSLLGSLKFKNVKLIKVSNLEKAFPELSTAKANRSITEYYWTLTPYLLFYLVFLKKSCVQITYLDADQFFYSDPKVIFDEIGDSDVAIMPHRFPDSINSSSEHGEFNVSWVTFRDSLNAQKCLEWWKSSCHKWCYAAGDETRYGDQKYLDEFPKRFKDIHIIQNIGAGVAPWNLVSFNFHDQLILFHFQSFRLRSQKILTSIIPKFDECNLKCFKKFILIPYFLSLQKNMNRRNKNTINSSDKSLSHTDNQVLFFHIFNKVFVLHGKKLNVYLFIFNKVRFKIINKKISNIIKYFG